MWRAVFVVVGVAFAGSSASWFVAARHSRDRSRFLSRVFGEEVQRRYWRALAAKNDLIGALFVTVAFAVLGVTVERDVRFADLLLLTSAGPLVVSLVWVERFRWAAAVSETTAETAQQHRESERQTNELSAQLARRLTSDGLETASVAVSAIYFPAVGLVGGDFLGCAGMPDGSVALLVGDVTGHGLDAGIEAMRVKDLAMAILRQDASPADALERANSLLYEGREVLATAFAAVCDRSTLRYASAGHVPVVVDGARRSRLLGPTSRLLGAFPKLDAEEISVELERGDVIVAFTDGLLEAYGPDGGLEENEIAALVAAGDFARLRDVLKSRRHVPLRDDIAALQVRVLPLPPAR